MKAIDRFVGHVVKQIIHVRITTCVERLTETDVVQHTMRVCVSRLVLPLKAVAIVDQSLIVDEVGSVHIAAVHDHHILYHHCPGCRPVGNSRLGRGLDHIWCDRKEISLHVWMHIICFVVTSDCLQDEKMDESSE